jgi:predicted HTH domain antitoxin
MKQITVGYADDLPEAAQVPEEEVGGHIRLMAALKMFELGRIASGMAAELAGLSRTEFLEDCGRYRASVFNYAPDELEAELRADVAAARAR